jgi:hypothetical protein
MVRPNRIGRAAGTLLVRAAVGFIGLAIIVNWTESPPGTGAKASYQAGDPPQNSTRVALQVAEGELAQHVTVVDPSGRELAIVTCWYSGDITVVSNHSDRTGASYHLYTNGSVRMRVAGTARVTLIDAEPDGTISSPRRFNHPKIWQAEDGPSEASAGPNMKRSARAQSDSAYVPQISD